MRAERVRTEPRNHASIGAERTRTAVRARSTDSAYVDRGEARGVDKRATKAARDRQAAGFKALDEFFAYTPAKAPFNPQTGRAISADPKIRLRWRQWRDSTFPARVRRRRRRKLARASRKANRS